MLIQNEIERIEEMLVETDPTDDKYPKLLTVLGQLASVFRELKDLDVSEEEPVKEPWHEDSPVPVPPAEKVETDVALTFDEVRTICTEAMGMGVKLSPIVAKFVEEGKPAKLTNVDPSKYEELVTAVRQEADNAR